MQISEWQFHVVLKGVVRCMKLRSSLAGQLGYCRRPRAISTTCNVIAAPVSKHCAFLSEETETSQFGEEPSGVGFATTWKKLGGVVPINRYMRFARPVFLTLGSAFQLKIAVNFQTESNAHACIRMDAEFILVWNASGQRQRAACCLGLKEIR